MLCLFAYATLHIVVALPRCTISASFDTLFHTLSSVDFSETPGFRASVSGRCLGHRIPCGQYVIPARTLRLTEPNYRQTETNPAPFASYLMWSRS